MTWKPSPLGFTFLALGVFFTTVEVWGTYDFFLRDQGEFNYIVLAGCGVALACAFLAPAADTAWRNGWYWGAGLALLALPLALAVIVYAGVQRTGGAADAAQQGTKQIESNRKGWEKTEKEAEADLAVDKQTVATESRPVGARSAPRQRTRKPSPRSGWTMQGPNYAGSRQRTRAMPRASASPRSVSDISTRSRCVSISPCSYRC